MYITSKAFNHGETIPQKYGRDFENINPPLSITDIPQGTRTFVLIMEDPDVPASAPVAIWDHWVVFNIPAGVTEIPERWTVEGVKGRGTRGELDYGGPRPPDREHRYFFKLYALNAVLDLPEGSVKEDVVRAMQGHILAQAELVGLFAPAQS